MDKNEKLINKIKNLKEKLDKEENPLKRGIYFAKLRFLIGRIEKQIAIVDIKEKYKKDVEDLKEKYEKARIELTTKKGEIIPEKKLTEAQLNKNTEYDPSSVDFIFKEELKENGGDIEKLIADLKETKVKSNIKTAYNIEQTYKQRQKYDKLNSELKEIQEQSSKNKVEEKEKQTKELNKTKALVIQQHMKGNIFTRIFNAIKEGFKQITKSKEITLNVQQEIHQEQIEAKEQLKEDIQKLNMQKEEDIIEEDSLHKDMNDNLSDVFNERKHMLNQNFNEKIEVVKKLMAECELELKQLKENRDKAIEAAENEYAEYMKKENDVYTEQRKKIEITYSNKINDQNRYAEAKVEYSKNSKRTKFLDKMHNEEAVKNIENVIDRWSEINSNQTNDDNTELKEQEEQK